MAECDTPIVVHLALGGNQGDVLAAFRRALVELAARGVAVTAVSPAYRSAALVARRGDTPGPDYWNIACAAETRLSPVDLLALVHDLEREAGRERRERWGDRPLDIDILRYGDQVLSTPELTVPHPAVGARPFVLQPLADLDPEVPFPPAGRTVGAMLEALADPWAGIEYVMFNWR